MPCSVGSGSKGDCTEATSRICSAVPCGPGQPASCAAESPDTGDRCRGAAEGHRRGHQVRSNSMSASPLATSPGNGSALAMPGCCVFATLAICSATYHSLHEGVQDIQARCLHRRTDSSNMLLRAGRWLMRSAQNQQPKLSSPASRDSAAHLRRWATTCHCPSRSATQKPAAVASARKRMGHKGRARMRVMQGRGRIPEMEKVRHAKSLQANQRRRHHVVGALCFTMAA